MSDVDILHSEHVVHLSVANEPEITLLFTVGLQFSSMFHNLHVKTLHAP